jgi:hypothetical protein
MSCKSSGKKELKPHTLDNQEGIGTAISSSPAVELWDGMQVPFIQNIRVAICSRSALRVLLKARVSEGLLLQQLLGGGVHLLP